MHGTRMRRVCGLSIAVWLALLVTGANAAVSDLKAATLRPADLPAEFTHSHVKVFAHYAPTMTVSTMAFGSPNPVSCTVPSSFRSSGWEQGMIEAFDTSKLSTGLQLCGYLFTTSSQAHLAYRVQVKTLLKPLLKLKLASKLPMTRVGSESMATRRDMKECVCQTIGMTRQYDAVFRHDNALVVVEYTGPAMYSVDSFLRLVTHSNARLH